MSWQCPICETVNQDVTPVCTVCDHLAPVVDSYLSLESIENLRDYNDKLEEVHLLEIAKDYSAMLDVSIQAMALYKDNDLAIEKARQAMTKLQASQLEDQVIAILGSAIDKKNLNLAQAIIKIADSFGISSDKFEELKKDTKKKVSRKKDVDDILHQSFLAIIDLNTELALKIVEEGLLIHTASKRLQARRTEIQTFIRHLNGKKEGKSQVKPLRRPPIKSRPNSSKDKEKKEGKEDNMESEKIETGKRKFPKIKINK